MTIDRNNGKKKILNQKARRYIFFYSFVAFAIVHFCIFYIAVNINSILLAFKQSTRTTDGKIVEIFTLGNFKTFFEDLGRADSPLREGFLNTLKYFVLGMFVMVPVSLSISYFLYKKIAFYKGFRIILFLPSIISGVVFVSMFKLIIEPFGLIHELLGKIGVDMPFLLINEKTATPTIMFYVFWTGLAGNMILYQGAMNRLPNEVIEAGRLDGITWTRELWSVVLPMIWPTFSMTVILGFTGLFSASGPILLFLESGSGVATKGTNTLSYYIFDLTRNGIYYYPAAMGIFFTVCSLPIVFGIRYLMSKIDPEVEY